MTVHPKYNSEKDVIMQSLENKVQFLAKNIAEFKDIYIGNYYGPEIVRFLLNEYLFLQKGYEISKKKVKKSDMNSQEPVMFGKAIKLVRDYCAKL